MHIQGQKQIAPDTQDTGLPIHTHVYLAEKHNYDWQAENRLWVSERETVMDSGSNGVDLETGGPLRHRRWLTDWLTEDRANKIIWVNEQDEEERGLGEGAGDRNARRQIHKQHVCIM